jgi:uncharacterized protein YlxW (UPF0749 family)
MNQFEMVAMIVAVVMLASIIKTSIRAKHGLTRDRKGNEVPVVQNDADAERLRDEVKTLKERIAVLERLATDDNGARALDREIEKLR